MEGDQPRANRVAEGLGKRPGLIPGKKSILGSSQYTLRTSSGTEIRISITAAGRLFPLAATNKVASGLLISLF